MLLPNMCSKQERDETDDLHARNTAFPACFSIWMGLLRLERARGQSPCTTRIRDVASILPRQLNLYARSECFQGLHYRVAFKLRQEPGSYTVQPQTIGVRGRSERIHPMFLNEEFEWKTHRRDTVFVYQVMISPHPCQIRAHDVMPSAHFVLPTPGPLLAVSMTVQFTMIEIIVSPCVSCLPWPCSGRAKMREGIYNLVAQTRLQKRMPVIPFELCCPDVFLARSVCASVGNVPCLTGMP